MLNEPNISVIIIGVNVESFLSNCIRSVKLADYPQEKLQIIYVDGGSNDRSLAIAAEWGDEIQVIKLKDSYPTPGRGRNAGLELATAPYIQYLDADTMVNPEWFRRALPFLNEKVVAVCGYRFERFPRENIYHLIAQIEWNGEPGLCDAFGGDVLIERKTLLDLGGYDPLLVAGEDPELSYRLRGKGKSISRLDVEMTIHDLQMKTFNKYFKRAFRTGHAYAEVASRYFFTKERFWFKDLCRISLTVSVPILFIILGMIFQYPFYGLAAALLVGFKPLRKLRYFKRRFHLSWAEALCYALHLSFVVYPQFLGVLRYLYTKISGKALKNSIAHIKL